MLGDSAIKEGKPLLGPLVASDDLGTAQRSMAKWTSAALLVFVVVAANHNSLNTKPETEIQSSTQLTAKDGIVDLKVSNADYGSQWMEKYESGNKLYPWRLLVEPHRTTTFELICTPGSDSCGVGTTWTLSYDNDVEEDAANINEELARVDHDARAAVHTCKVAGKAWKLEVATAAGETAIFKGVCKFVRREINKVTPADRDRFLSALGKYHRIKSTEAGKAMGYGNRFAGMDDVLKGHLARASFAGGFTPMHTSPSFVTGHSLFHLRLDEQLRLIDPSLPVSLPYWNYLADVSKLSDYDLGSATVFKDEWFGGVGVGSMLESSPLQGALNTKAPAGVNAQVNSFGTFGQVSNYNHDQLATRWNKVCGYEKTSLQVGAVYNPIPSCETTVARTESLKDVDSWITLDDMLEGYHGGVHMGFGGAEECFGGGFPALKEVAGDVWWSNHETFLDMVTSSLLFYWQILDDNSEDLLSCPKARSCESGASDKAAVGPVPGDPCRCSAKGIGGKDLSTYSFGELEQVFWNDVQGTATGGLAYLDEDVAKHALEGLNELEDQEKARQALQLLCEIILRPGSVSPMGTPFESPKDPIFWVIHNVFERMYHSVRLTNPPNKEDSVFDWTWPHYDETSTAIDTIGHNYNDPLYITAGSLRQEGSFGADVGLNLKFDEHITNAIAISIIEPSRVALPHVYDVVEMDSGEGVCQ